MIIEAMTYEEPISGPSTHANNLIGAIQILSHALLNDGMERSITLSSTQ
jgi:hypothetical protein